MSTEIYWKYIKKPQLDGRWTIGHSVFNVSATTTAPYNSYALGLNEWYVVGDSNSCNKGENYTIKLKLSGCSDGQFTCSDGQCIPMKER